MLEPRKKYLQIALNSTLDEASRIISQIPLDSRIILEAGTPLIKHYGVRAIESIRTHWEGRIFGQVAPAVPFSGDRDVLLNLVIRRLEKKRVKKPEIKNSFTPYIVADLKCMDRGQREVQIAKEGGANAVVALGSAPVETLDAFIQECEKNGLDSMLDMMNVEYPLEILRQLKKPPQVVIVHRGVDEETFDPESEIPYHEIQRIKENYDMLVAIAGGDTFQEVQRAIFNDADIVVVWKSFYQSTQDTAKLAKQFLKEIR